RDDDAKLPVVRRRQHADQNQHAAEHQPRLDELRRQIPGEPSRDKLTSLHATILLGENSEHVGNLPLLTDVVVLDEAGLVAAVSVELQLFGAHRQVARRFTDRESREFGVWRGGDPVARLTYVASGLLVGGLIIWAPFIPIWEKWFPFVLAIAAYWLPDVQVA